MPVDPSMLAMVSLRRLYHSSFIMASQETGILDPNQGEGSNTAERTSTDELETMDAAAAAVRAAKTLNASLLSADRERAYVLLKAEHDSLTASFKQQQILFDESREKIVELQTKVVSLNDESVSQRENALREVRRAKNWEDKDRDSQERLARVEVEADSLRQEVSRLTASNKALNTQLVEMQTQSSLNSSSTAPLQYENLRLRSELDSLTAHVSWMESELSNRTMQLSQVRSTESAKVQNITNELQSVRSQNEELVASHDNIKIKYSTAVKRLDSLQKQLLETEQNHSEELHHLNSELTTERRLVALTKEQCARMEDRYNNVIRDMESMKMLAAASDQDHALEIVQLKEEMETELHKVLEEMKHQSEWEEMKAELDRVRAEKLKLEENLIQHVSASKALPASNSIQRHWVLEEGSKNGAVDGGIYNGPLSLTDLYDRLAAKDDELRSERLERQRVELYLERIQKDIESKGPLLRQQRKDYDKMVSQHKDLQLRFHEIVEESRLIRDDFRVKERESKEFQKECSELRLENVDLATQVQTLLRRIVGNDSFSEEQSDDLLGFGSIEELQNQNQRLLREHHRLTDIVSQLESQLASDTIQKRIVEAESELKQLREERQSQEALITGIVQQRDLYRALLAKNDAQILAAVGGESAAMIDKDQLQQIATIQQQKQELEATVAKLNADLMSTNNARSGLEERIIRMDTYAESLAVSNTKLQSELSAAKAAVARSEAEASYYKQKVERLEEDSGLTKNELTRVIDSRKEFMRLNDGLQADLINLQNRVTKLEQELSHAEAKLRLSETQTKAAQAAELRLNGEISTLRIELSRQESFIESMQRIETALSLRANESRTQLEEETKRLNETLSIERGQHRHEVDNFVNKISSLELQIDSLQTKREEALSSVTTLNKTVSDLSSSENSLKQQCSELQTALNNAKIRLGDLDADLTGEDRVKTLSIELAAAKDALDAAKKQSEDYQTIAKTAESSLLALSRISDEYKVHTDAELRQLKEQVEAANRTAQVKQEALNELMTDLSTSRGAHEKAVNELQEKLKAADLEIQFFKDAEVHYKERTNALSFELDSSRADARAAKDNYERELALHSAACNDARSTRSQLEAIVNMCHLLERENESLKAIQSSSTETSSAETSELQTVVATLEVQLQDARNLNGLLHGQLSSVSKALAQLESERDSRVPVISQVNAAGEQNESIQQIHELQEIIKFMRSEREMLESQLNLARRAVERERSAAEVSKRALEAARAEIDISVARQLQDDNNESTTDLTSKIKAYDDQMKMMRESNQLLRDEVNKLSAQLLIAQQERISAVNALDPMTKERQSLEIQNAALEVEKSSLIKEVDGWKERVQSLVTKFHQIDPEEHSKALAQVEEVKKELSLLQLAKENAEKECTSAKALVSRLNKEVSKIKTQNETLTKNLEQVNAEKEALAKVSSDLTTVMKERDLLKAAKEAAEGELENAKIENEGNKSRIENLTTFLRKTKASVTELTAKLQQATQAEQEAKKSLSKEMEAHKSALLELEVVKTSNINAETNALKVQNHSSAPQQTLEPSDTVKLFHATNDDVMAMDSGIATKDQPVSIPQLPSEGFKFSPTPVSEPVFSSAAETPFGLPSSSNNTEDKGINRPAPLDTSRPSSNTSLKELAALEPSADIIMVPKNVESTELGKEDYNPVLDSQKSINENTVSSVGGQIEDENMIREKLLKRKRDKKGQALLTKTLEPSSSLNESELKPSTAFVTALTHVTEVHGVVDNEKVQENQELRDAQVPTMSSIESEKGSSEMVQPSTVEEPGVIDQKADLNESVISAGIVEISSDSVIQSKCVEEQSMAGIESSNKVASLENPDEAISSSNLSKKRAIDESTEVVSFKVPRLTQSKEDENPTTSG